MRIEKPKKYKNASKAKVQKSSQKVGKTDETKLQRRPSSSSPSEEEKVVIEKMEDINTESKEAIVIDQDEKKQEYVAPAISWADEVEKEDREKNPRA